MVALGVGAVALAVPPVAVEYQFKVPPVLAEAFKADAVVPWQ